MKTCIRCGKNKDEFEFIQTITNPDWCHSCTKEYHREYHGKLRLDVIKGLGGKCVRCGFSDLRALQIDHINGGGSQDRKNIGTRQLYGWIIKNIIDAKEKYQILCANCNWIKKYENGEVGRKI